MVDRGKRPLIIFMIDKKFLKPISESLKELSLLFNKNSPYYKSVKIIFNKLKTFNNHQCFGNNIKTVFDAMKNIMIFGNTHEVKKYISNKKKILKQ